jgi:hypothetical protein
MEQNGTKWNKTTPLALCAVDFHCMVLIPKGLQNAKTAKILEIAKSPDPILIAFFKIFRRLRQRVESRFPLAHTRCCPQPRKALLKLHCHDFGDTLTQRLLRSACGGFRHSHSGIFCGLPPVGPTISHATQHLGTTPMVFPIQANELRNGDPENRAHLKRLGISK